MKIIPISKKKLSFVLLFSIFLGGSIFVEITVFHLTTIQYAYGVLGMFLVGIIILVLILKMFDRKPAFIINEYEIIDNSNIYIQPIHIPLNSITLLQLKKIFGISVMIFTVKKGYQLFQNKSVLIRFVLELQMLFNKRQVSHGWFISSLSAQASIQDIFYESRKQWKKQRNIKS